MEGFTTNFTTTNLVEILHLHGTANTSLGTTATVLKCEDVVHDNPAATKCLVCNFYLCEECTTEHKKHRATRDHKIATLAELKEGGVKQLEQKRYCADHEGEELKLYCRTCQEVICRDCTIVTHKQHDYTFIKEIREELTKKMECLIASVGGKEAKYQDILERIHQAREKEKQKLANEEAKAVMFFDKHVEELQRRIAAVQSHKATILSDLAQASAVYMKQLLADEESLQFSHTRLTSALSFAQQQLSSASNTDLAMMSKQVIQQLEALHHHEPDEETTDESHWVMQLLEDDPLHSEVERTLLQELPFAAVSSSECDNSDTALDTAFITHIELVDPEEVMQELPVAVNYNRPQTVIAGACFVSQSRPPDILDQEI